MQEGKKIQAVRKVTRKIMWVQSLDRVETSKYLEGSILMNNLED